LGGSDFSVMGRLTLGGSEISVMGRQLFTRVMTSTGTLAMTMASTRLFCGTWKCVKMLWATLGSKSSA
jgi:hypothetical protein